MTRHARLTSLRLCLLVGFLLLPVLSGADAPPGGDKVHPLVWQRLQAGDRADVLVLFAAQADLSGAAALPTKEEKGRYVLAALHRVAAESQAEMRAALEAQGIAYRSFVVVNVLQVRADGAMIQALAARDEVARIVPNPRVRAIPDRPTWTSNNAAQWPGGIEPNLVRVGADRVWAMGYTGQGIVVAGQDTGYQWDHPALKGQYRGWDGAAAQHDYNWHDAIHSDGGTCGADAPAPCDDDGHGTHTMGIIVGDDGAGRQIGMAPGARWIGCRNMDQGVGTPATYLECFEFFLAPYPVGGTVEQGRPELAPDVVNNSWSCPPSEGCDAGTLEAAVEALRAAGIVVVVSAGNDGAACATVGSPPAIYQQSFSVGAFAFDLDLDIDQIASFSSRGPVTYGGDTYTKPDLAAPGVGIVSSVRGGGYGPNTGTSMAAPHVAGAVALLLSAAPAYRGRVAAIEAALTGSAEPMTTTQECGDDGPDSVPNNVWGWGILDVQAAVRAVAPLPYRYYFPLAFIWP